MFKPFVPYAIFTTRATCCLSKLCAIRHTFKLCATCIFKLVPYVSSLNRVPYAISLHHVPRVAYVNCVPCIIPLDCVPYVLSLKLVPCQIFKPFVSHVASLYCVPYAICLSRSCHRHPFLLSCPQFTPMSITVKLQRKCAVKYASVPTYVRDMNF